MPGLAKQIEEVVGLLPGYFAIEERSDSQAIVPHPVYPFNLFFSQQRNRITVAAFAKRVPAPGGYFYSLSDFAKTKLNRTFGASRFETQPQRVANEIESQIVSPSISASIEVLKRIAEGHHLASQQMDLADDIAQLLNRPRIDRTRSDDTMYISLGYAFEGAYGNIEIRKSGYIQMTLRSLSPKQARAVAKALSQAQDKPT